LLPSPFRFNRLFYRFNKKSAAGINRTALKWKLEAGYQPANEKLYFTGKPALKV
jgi:hypothetical protein